MKTLFVTVLLAFVLYYVHAAPTPFDGDVNETTDKDDKESQATVESESDEKHLTPQQLGRLSKINGEFFQLYGELNEKNGNLDGITGNRLNFHGGLIELAANEHTLRSISKYIEEGQKYHYKQAESKTGRDAEIEKELGDQFGELSGKFSQIAELERDQADLKQSQLAAETKIYKLADQEADLKGKETFQQLEIADVEESQIEVENSAAPIMYKIFELEDEQYKNSEGKQETGAAAAATETPV